MGANIRFVARMERQIALCDLACNPGSTPHERVAPHCANRAKERAIGSMRATSANEGRPYEKINPIKLDEARHQGGIGRC